MPLRVAWGRVGVGGVKLGVVGAGVAWLGGMGMGLGLASVGAGVGAAWMCGGLGSGCQGYVGDQKQGDAMMEMHSGGTSQADAGVLDEEATDRKRTIDVEESQSRVGRSSYDLLCSPCLMA